MPEAYLTKTSRPLPRLPSQDEPRRMQTQLRRLRDDLARLQNTRRMIRWGNGLSLLIVAVIATLALAFVADVALEMSRLQRLVLLGLVIGTCVWAFKRFTKPWLVQSESLIEVALLVERHQQIDSDLVAAIQFEQPEAASWGSAQLESAVITHVARISPQLNVFEGFSQTDFKRRTLLAATAVVAVAICWAAYPGYLNAFLSRLFVGSGFYPTKTQIVKVVVNDTPVFDGKVLQDRVLTPFGHPVKFEIAVGGEISSATQTGKLRVQSLDGQIATDVEITAAAATAPDAMTSTGRLTLRGELPRLMDSVTFEVFVGDARTVPFTIEAVPLPVVDVRLKVTPPAYAAAVDTATASDKGDAKWHLSVIEGSRIDVVVEALNKDLDWVKLWIGKDAHRLVPTDGSSKLWSLKTEDTPLASVSEPVEYRIEVLDKQSLQLEAPIRGTIRLKQDLPPRIAVTTRTTKVISTAKPPIAYSVQDDYGISKVVAQVQVSKENGDSTDREIEILSPAAVKTQTLHKGTHKLDLAQLKLVKGDELKVTFVAYDYRGTREPKKSFSEPLLFHVTDQQGILSGLLETDLESAKQLDAIIRRELGIGKEK